MTEIKVWGYTLNISLLSQNSIEYIQSLPATFPDVEWVWSGMSRVWQDLHLDNKKPLADQHIADFYNHLVWLMNGIFTSLDPISAAHRFAISNYLSQGKAKKTDGTEVCRSLPTNFEPI